MITGSDAALLARSWAEQASRAEGGEWREVVEEFDLGYVVWVQPPAGTELGLGALPRRVIDRETGEVTVWGSIPHQLVMDRYREHRQANPAAPTTVDPVATIRRLASRPTVVDTVVHARFAHDRRVRTARGAKGDQALNHHPVVRDWLAMQPAGTVCRGADRHAELILISDVLHAYDLTARGETAIDQARGLLRFMELQLVQVSPVAGPGEPARPCQTCRALWAHLNLMAPAAPVNDHPSLFAEDRPDFPEALRPFRSPPGIFGAMSLLPPPAAVPTALAAIGDRYSGAIQVTYSPGRVHSVAPFSLDPVLMANAFPVLDDLTALVGVASYQIGKDGESGGLLAADDRGRIFAIDQAGEWFIGPDIDAALLTLFYGGAQPRLHDDGTW